MSDPNTKLLFPNRGDEVQLYVRSMGKMLKVTAIFSSDAEANAYMARHRDEGVVAVSGSLVILANVHDKGATIK